MTVRAARPAAVAVLLVALVGAVLVGLARPAAAHASLESTTPTDGAALEEAPDELVLRFNEHVTLPSGGAVRVHDSRGEPLSGVEAAPGGEEGVVRASLPEGLGEDTYIVTWRAVSADGHPIRGAFVYTVGDAAAADDALVAQVFAGGDDAVVAGGATVSRWLEYAFVLFAAGGALFLARVHRDGVGDRRRLVRLVRVGAVAGVVVTLVGTGFQAALTSGAGLAGLVDPAALSDSALSGYGVSAGVRLLGLAALLGGLVGAGTAPLALVGALVASASFALTGHTLTTEPLWLVVTADVAHLVAAAVWFGGLGLLLVVLRAVRLADDPVAGAGVVARFSALAAGSVVVVGVAGLALTWAEVRVPRALVSTAYGWALLAKLVLVAAVAAAGAHNNRRLVPAIARVTRGTAVLDDGVARRVPAGGSGDAPAGGAGADEVGAADTAWQRLRRTVGVEVVGIVAVLAVTAVLVNLQPAAEAAGVTGAYSTYEALGDHLVNLTVDPNRAGANEVHLYLLTEEGRPAADAVEDLRLELSLPAEDIGPIERTPSVAGPGHWLLSGRELSLPGRWEIEVVAQVSKFERLTTTIPVVVGG